MYEVVALLSEAGDSQPKRDAAWTFLKLKDDLAATPTSFLVILRAGEQKSEAES